MKFELNEGPSQADELLDKINALDTNNYNYEQNLAELKAQLVELGKHKEDPILDRAEEGATPEKILAELESKADKKLTEFDNNNSEIVDTEAIDLYQEPLNLEMNNAKEILATFHRVSNGFEKVTLGEKIKKAEFYEVVEEIHDNLLRAYDALGKDTDLRALKQFDIFRTEIIKAVEAFKTLLKSQ